MASSCSHEICKQVVRNLRLLADPQSKTLEQERAEEEAEQQKQMIEKHKRFNEMQDNIFRNRKRKTAEDTQRMMEEIIKQDPMLQNPTLKIGHKHNILQLLSSSQRDYLIRSDHQHVKINQLSCKYVLLYFWILSDHSKPQAVESIFIRDLKYIYYTYSSIGTFEVVFIALGNNKAAFDKAFSPMPWLAIPHEDYQTRDSFPQLFGLPYRPDFLEAFLFDSEGTVVRDKVGCYISEFGIEGFPFTEQRLEQLRHESRTLWDQLVVKKQKLSLSALLGSFLISSEGIEVLTSELEGKTVGLLFFNLEISGDSRTNVLLDLWKSLEKDGRRKNFEIVLVNATGCASIYLADGGFKRLYGCNNPWYTLPVGVHRKLRDVFRIERSIRDVRDEGYFIVLKPDRFEALSYFALDILRVYGMDAYPFTLERAVAIETKKQQEVMLDDILDPSCDLLRGYDRISLPYRGTTPLSSLIGKRVLLLFATFSCFESGSFMPALKRMYDEKKWGSDDDFEIIYVPLDCVDNLRIVMYDKGVKQMRWFVFPFEPKQCRCLFRLLFNCELPGLPAIVAFGADGCLQTKESNLIFKEDWTSSFPFIQADMAAEVRREVVNRHGWDLGRIYPPKKSPPQLKI